jgi:uncharacterized repeat protein (TIGR01451 family)
MDLEIIFPMKNFNVLMSMRITIAYKKLLQAICLVGLACLSPINSACAEVFYGITSTGIFSVDSVQGGPATQVATFAVPMFPTTNAATLATRPSDGMLFYLDSQAANPNLWRWDPSTPAIAPVLVGTPGATTVTVIRLGFDSTNTLYAMNSGPGSSLWTLDQNTGAILTVTPASGYNAGNLPGGGDLCLHPTTGVMYMVAGTNLFTVTPAGVVTLLGAMTGLPGSATGCAFSSIGQLVVSPSATLYTVNIGTLAATAMPVATGVAAFGDLGTSPGRSANLRVSKTANNVTPGNSVSFTVTVTNGGPDKATDVRILDALPAGLTFVSATPSQGGYSSAGAGVAPACTATGIWCVGTLNNGASATLTINATVTGTTPITNWAQVAYMDQTDPNSTPGTAVPPSPAGQDDQASATITPSPDLQIAKTATSSFAVGTNATYSITVNNLLGSLTTSGTYTVIDNMPAGLTIVGTPAGTGWNCSASTTVQLNCTNATAIAAGASNANAITLTVLPDATASPSVTNTATVSGGGEPASNNGNNSSTITTSVCTAGGCPDLVVNKSSSASFTVGAVGTYTLSVKNNGGLTTGANTYTISDTLPTGITLNTASGGAGWTINAGWACTGTAGGSVVSCSRSTALGPGATSTTVVFPVTVANTVAACVATPTSLCAVNTATVSGGGEPAAVTGNNSTTISTPVIAFDLTVTKIKTTAANFVLGVNSATYTITVNNIGAVPSTGTYTVTDALPTGLTLNAAPTAGAGWTCTANTPLAGDNIVGGGRVVCTSATAIAAAGTSTTIIFPVRVAAAAAPSVTNTAGVSDPNEASNLQSNNSSTVPSLVDAPDLVVTKSHNGNFTVGVNNTYTITVSNIGALTTSTANVVVTDTLPAGLTFVSGTGTGWNACTAVGQVVTCVLPFATAIAANSSANPITLTVTPTAAAATASPVTNNVSVAGGNEPAGNAGNNSFADSTGVYYAPTITKAFAPITVAAGASATLTLTIGNPAGNTVSLLGAAITDNFPAGMSVAATPNFTNSCGGTISSGNNSGDTSIVLASGGPVAAGASCTISVSVISSTIGANANTTLAVSSANTVTGGTATATLTVTAPGNPILTKVSSPNPVQINSPATLTFTISNKATLTNDMGFTDTLPAGVIVSTPATFGGTCTSTTGAALVRTATAGGNTIAVTGVDLAANASCTVTINIQSASPGSYPNTSANISALAAGLTATTLSDTLIVERPTLTKAFSPATMPVNAISTLTFTITNGSQAYAETGLGFTETLPVGVTLANGVTSNTCSGTLTNSANAALSAGDTTVKLASGTLALGQTSCTISVNVTSAAAATYNNLTANVTGLSANLGNSATATLVVTPPPVLSKTFSPVEVGVAQISTLTFTITNATGNPAQASLAFTDTLPANLVLANGTSSNTCNGTLTDAANNPLAANATSIKLAGGTMTSGTASCTITVNVLSNTPAAYTNNTTNMSGVGGGLSTTGLTSTLTVRGTTLTKAYSSPSISFNAGAVLTFTITNSGGNPAQTGLSFTDTLAGIKLFAVPASPQCGGTVTGAAGGSTIGFSGGNLAAGVASCTVTVSIYGATTGTFVNNSGNMSGLSAGMTNSVNATIVVNALPDLTKAFSAASMNAGQTVTLTFTISNVAGAPAQTGLTFSDALPANLLIAATPNVVNGCGGTPTVTATAGTSTFTIGGTGVNSAIGPSTCTISVNVTSSVAGSYVNGAVQVTTNMNNSVTNQTLTVAALPSLTFLKTVSVYSDPMNGTTNPKFIPGAIAEYTITASNSGGLADANSIFITDLLPPNTLLLVDDMALPVGSGPVQFIQGGTSSTLTYTKATDLVFSNNSGGNWLAGPAASGCDPAINAIRINPKGTFVGGGSSFQLKFRVCIQ